MKSLTSPMLTALAPRVSDASVSRIRTLVFEVYASDAFPDSNGLFDPTNAVALWARGSITWLGHTYQRRVISHSGFSQFKSGEFNNITLTLENADRYFSAFVLSNDVDGMRLVARYINSDYSTTLADSVQMPAMRLEQPDGSDIDREQGELTAREELASLDIEIPKRRVSPEDPEGRSPNDPLFEGILLNAHPSSVKTVQQVPTSRFFGLIRGFRDVVKYNQWSSVTSSVADQIIPLVIGRVQAEGLPAFWDDIGYYIIGLWLWAAHKVTSITNFFLPGNFYWYGPWAVPAFLQTHVHLGDPGGTGTNATPDDIENNYPQNTALLSRTAYAGLAPAGPETETQPFANPEQDSAPTIAAIVCGEMDLPNGSGVFNLKGFSDSPVYATRFVLTSQDFFNLDARLVNDSELPAVHAERQRPILDKSNGEFLALMSHDTSAVTDGRLVRLNTTGLLDSRYFRHYLDSGYPDPLITNRDDIYSVLPGGTNPSGGDQQLTNGAGLSSQSVAGGAWKYYYIDTPIGADQLQVTLTGSGDGTTFLRLSSKPTLSAYDTYAYTASPQIVTVTNPTAGRWWVGVAGYQPGGTVTVGVNFSIIAVVTGGAVESVLPIRPLLRKAYTINIQLTDTINASDFLNDVVLRTGRLFKLYDSAGKIKIKAKKASDSSYLISDASIGNTSILIANVEPWRASLTGYVLINPGLTTSEYRTVTSAQYHAATGNAVTLSVSGTGLSASGATLSGGSTTVPASGTVTVGSVAAAGTDVAITIWGIPITYTVTSQDSVGSIAGILAAMINADPNANQYFRAVWNEGAQVAIYCTVGTLGFASALVSAHDAQLDSPVTAPTASATGSGSLTPGVYYLGYTFVDGSGNETLMSPLQTVTIASGQKVSVTSLGTLPTGVAEVNWYFSPAQNDDQVQFWDTNAGGAFTIDSLPDTDNDFPPTVNQTGGETIRIMGVFNQYNIRAGSFKWSPSKSKVNQITGSFVDAANGFKRTPITVNDRAHQRKVKKVNKEEFNLSGVDNFSQATRLLNAALAEKRDAGDAFKWATDDAGIAFEVGDVVALSSQYVDPISGAVVREFVNQPVTLEETHLREDFDVAFVGQIYSSSLLEGQTGRKNVAISSTLKYFDNPPPVATNLVLTVDENFLTGFIGDFDFGQFAGSQVANIYVKGPAVGPSYTEPDDSTYKLVDRVTPSNLTGHFEYRAATGGKYWVKVVTQSAFGQSEASGHPVASVSLRPAAPTGLTAYRDSTGDWFIKGVGHPREVERPESYMVRIRRPADDVTMRDIPVSAGIKIAAVFETVTGSASVSKNNVYGTSNSTSGTADTIQRAHQEGFVITGVVTTGTGSGHGATIYLGEDMWQIAIKWQITPANTTLVAYPFHWYADAFVPLSVPTVGGVCYFKLMLVGTELKMWFAGSPIPDTKPADVILRDVPDFPADPFLRFSMLGTDAKVENIMIGGLVEPQTVYTVEQQTNDNGSGMSTIDVEMWQTTPFPNVDGESVRDVFP